MVFRIGRHRHPALMVLYWVYWERFRGERMSVMAAAKKLTMG